MQYLFAEKEDYDKLLKESRKFRRNAYIIIMLLWDDTYAMHFDDNVSAALSSTEGNFYLEHYDFVTGLFPKAKDVLVKAKFLDA
ncbi:MAG: hypothetical protein KBA66_21840 [Leptospiraceae bacterium]|nr:hypothetical protein [Leptospiraceae bacterium]